MKLAGAVVGVVLVLCVGEAHAGSVLLGLAGGAGLPAGNFDEIAQGGWHIGGTATWMYRPRSGLGVDVAYLGLGAGPDPKAVEVGGPGSTFEPSVIQMTGHYLRLVSTEGPVTPWFKLGLGSYISKLRVEGGQVTSDNSHQSFGLNAGIGANYTVGERWAIGISGTYHHFQRKKVPPPDPAFIFSDEDTGDLEATGVYTLAATLTWGIAPSE